MATNKKYWVGLEELHETEEFVIAQKNEFSKDPLSVDEFMGETELSGTSTSRRDFLKFLGFGVTAATLAACETPVINSIPYLNKPETITPGIPTYYASTYYDGTDYASILVKTREGRPIFIKGNARHGGVNEGTVNARINASVLALYDSTRLRAPQIDGTAATWTEIDSQLSADLRAIAGSGGRIALLTNTVISPSTNAAIDQFKNAFGAGVVSTVTYDAVSSYGIRKANEQSFGKAIIPDYDFSKARVIVSIAADFMNSWLFHNQYVPQYARNRNAQADWMSKHFHFESALSLTGSNADERIPILPSQEGQIAVALHNEVARRTGGSVVTLDSGNLPTETVSRIAESLVANRGRSLVVAGSNDPNVQVVVNAINGMLDNYGSTISTNVEIFIKQGDDAAVIQLVDDMNAGRIQALLVFGNNPAYSMPNADAFRTGLLKVPTTVSFSSWADETASLCKYNCPDSHYLESWNDYYPKTGHYALAQPVISRLYDTRQFQDSLLIFSGNTLPYHDFIRQVWQGYAPSMGSEAFLFDDFWFNALRNGSVNVKVPGPEISSVNTASLGKAVSNITQSSNGSSGFEVVLYTKVGIGDGSHATNPWLQELPDPISKITWDNYIAMNPTDAADLGFSLHYGQEEPATLGKITVGDHTFELPVIAQPGQKKGSVSIALGYGRGANEENIGRAAYRTKNQGGYEQDADGRRYSIGVNVYPLVQLVDGVMIYHQVGASIENTGKPFPIASTQTHHTLMGRTSVVKETSFSTFKTAPKAAYNPPHELAIHEDGITVMRDVDDVNLWREHPVVGVGHRWGMSIDLSTCIGCSACVTACHSENNVPVVGKDEVRRGRDMHWIRIDRYYSAITTMDEGMADDKGVIETYREMEVPAYDNPSTIFMPMLCQHCNHAPCETVCPVAATTHSNEGLNQMTYNRCIGTRYCANNCPYKVRRFNWFNYKAYDKFADINPAQDAMARMVLNPDVTVRSRGVMEKCTMCVQRIQAGKLEAKIKSTPVMDGLIVTACAEACPTNAITFGDINDTSSRIAAHQDDLRTYHALAEVGVKPSISYKVKVRNE